MTLPHNAIFSSKKNHLFSTTSESVVRENALLSRHSYILFIYICIILLIERKKERKGRVLITLTGCVGVLIIIVPSTTVINIHARFGRIISVSFAYTHKTY